MKFTREVSAAVTIRSIDERGLCIGDRIFPETVALTAQGIVENWDPKPIDTLSESDFASLLASGPELVILGTGATHVVPPRGLVFAMARRGVGFEAMHTAAAARTFNVLVGEDRHVAAVLYL